MTIRTALSSLARRLAGESLRVARVAAGMALCAALSGVGVLASEIPAVAAATSTLYAYPSGSASTPTACPMTTDASDQCTLTQALGLTVAGSTVVLAEHGDNASSEYVGNFGLSTTGTSKAEPVTIESEPGASADTTLSGNGGSSSGCPTTACSGSVLTIATRVYAAISGVSIEDADATGNGGAIDSEGTLTVTGSTFAFNSAAGNGTSAKGDGGAIDSGDGASGALTVSDSTFLDNSAYENGGAIDSGDNDGTGTLTVSDSTFVNNSAFGDGGAIDSGDDGGSGTLTVSDSTFSSNSNEADAGAIDSGDDGGSGTLTISDSTFAADVGDGGGAVDSGNFGGTGKLMISDSVFSNDTAYDPGGAVLIGFLGGGTASVTGSTFSGDNASDGFGGGAIEDSTAGAVTVRDSTFSHDSAVTGAALDDNGGGDLTVSSSTISGNIAANASGGSVANTSSGVLTLAADIVVRAVGGDCSGTITDGGYNISDDSSCGFSAKGSVSDSATIDGYLGSLGDYGGPTDTIPLLAISTTKGAKGARPDPAFAAIPKTFTAGSPAAAVCSTPDQRGIARSAPCDMGAFELTPSSTTLKLSATKVTFGSEQVERLSVAVSPRIAGSPPTGRVTVSAGAKKVCVITLASGKGTCSLSKNQLSAGKYKLSATYGGSTNLATSTSATKSLSVAS